jgi:L-histidine Nalpha-methyltransferase
VRVGNKHFEFGLHETMYMEISQKYSIEETDMLATQSGFEPVADFYDSRGWFADCMWLCI